MGYTLSCALLCMSVIVWAQEVKVQSLSSEIERLTGSPEQSCYRVEVLNDSTVVFKVDTIKRPDVLLLDAGEL
jgi:hypothetical protein